MLDTLKKLTSVGKVPTSTDLRAALAELDHTALHAAIEAAEHDVTKAVLSGAESAVERAEDRLSTAKRNRDRAQIARAELEKRLAAVEAAEAEAALNAERAAVEAEAKAVAAALRRDWPALQSKMVALLERLSIAEDAVQAVNTKLHSAGRTDIVSEVEWRARPRPKFAWEGAVSISSNVALPEIPEWGLTGYGPAVNTATSFYYKPPTSTGTTSNWPAPRVTPGPLTTFPKN